MVEGTAQPVAARQSGQLTGDHPQRAAMADDHLRLVFAHAEIVQGIQYPARHLVGSFATGWSEAERVGGPRVDRGARERLESLHFPGAEINLREPRIDQRFRVEQSGESQATRGRAARQRVACGQERAQTIRRIARVRRQPEVGRAVADSCRGDGARVANQMEFDGSSVSLSSQEKFSAR